jgi:hypothetical protein
MGSRSDWRTDMIIYNSSGEEVAYRTFFGNCTFETDTLCISIERHIENEAVITVSSKPTVPGDVNGDGIVNMLDLYYIAAHYGSIPGDPNYVKNYDVDDNGIINMLDIYMTALHFGQSNP